MTFLEHALAYASRGWPVFPLEPRGKHPIGRLVPHGLKNASLDPEQIRAWWTEEPEANIGIPTGIVFDVADLDSEEAVQRFLNAAQEHSVDVQAYPRSRTGNGRHVLVAPTGYGNRGGGLLPEMHWRGKGGYIVAPPSIHPDTGQPYQWLHEPNGGTVPPAPGFVLEMLRPRAAQPEQRQWGVPRTNIPSPNYIRAAIDAELDKLRSAPEGNRNNSLNDAAFALGQMVGAGWLSMSSAELDLRQAALATGLPEREINQTIHSGLQGGLLQPREAPLQLAQGQPGGVIVHGRFHPEQSSENSELQTLSSWLPMDLTPILEGDLESLQPVMLARSDELLMLYPGRSHSFWGEPECCKSWAAQIVIAQALQSGKVGLYIDMEAEARDVVGHLLLLGVSKEIIQERFLYVRPEEPLSDESRDALLTIAENRHPYASVLDGVDSAIAASGGDSDKNKDVVQWWAHLIRPVQVLTEGPTITIDHVIKDPEKRGRWAGGSGKKLALIDGAGFSFEVKAPFGVGRKAEIRIRLEKDRPGSLRPHQGSDREIAKLFLNSTGEKVHYTFQAPAKPVSEGGQRWLPTNIMERVSRALEDSPSPLSYNAIVSLVRGKREHIQVALQELAEQKYVERTPSQRGAAILHHSLRPFREAGFIGSRAQLGDQSPPVSDQSPETGFWGGDTSLPSRPPPLRGGRMETGTTPQTKGIGPGSSKPQVVPETGPEEGEFEL